MMTKKLFALMFCMVFLVGSVSAFEFDNVKSFDKSIGEYGMVKIKNAFGMGADLIDLELKENTDTCGSNCEAIKDITLYEDGALIQDIRFETKEGNPVSISDYQFYIQTGMQQVMERKLSLSCGEETVYLNGSVAENCKTISNYISVDRPVWQEYQLGSVVTKGDYTIKLIGKKGVTQTVDWIIKSQGNWITEWALWTGVGAPIAGWDFDQPDDSSTKLVDVLGGVFNLTSASGSITIVPGLIGNAGLFSSEVMHGGDILEEIGINRSISIWINATNTGGRYIIVKYDGGNDGWLIQTDSFEKIAAGTPVIVSNLTYATDDNWTHIVLLRTTDGTELYINGVISAEGAGTVQNHLTTNAFGIGGLCTTASCSSSQTYFEGEIDEVFVWNRTLGQDEINILYNNGQGVGFGDEQQINLISPVDGLGSISSTIEFIMNATVIGNNITNISLYTNTSGTFSIVNTSIFGDTSNNETSNLTESSIPEGTFLWGGQACFLNGECIFSEENRTFSVDTIVPILDVTSPTGDQGTFSSGENLSLEWTIIEDNPDTCFYDYAGSNTTVSCSLNATNLTVTSSTALELTFHVNDTAGHSQSQTINWTYSFVELSVTFNENVTETSSQDFELNLTTGENILSITSNLIYDGSSYLSTASCANNNCSLKNKLDIPLVTSPSEIKAFFWNFTIFNGSDSNTVVSSTSQQNVSRIYLEQCNATFPTEALNFTAYDEQNLSAISPYQFDGTFDIWVGTGAVVRNNSFSQNVTEMTLCLQPNVTMKTSSIINYDEEVNTSLYTSRFFYFNNHSISNVTQLINLYLLKSSASTSFILKVQDQSLLPVTDALIEIHRFYPGDNEFRIVQIAETDDNGKSIGFFQTETVDYKFIIKKGGETLLETGTQKVIPETSPFTLTFNIGTDLGEPWKTQNNIPDLLSNLTFDESTGMVTYVYIDTSNNLTLGRLFVQEQSLTNSSDYTTICNDNSTLSSATIVCNVGNSSGFYIAGGYITRTGEALDKQINFQIETLSSVAGILGLFFGFFIILVASFMFVFNEVAGIWAITITIFLINISGLIKFGGVFVTAIMGIAIILTWILER